LNPKLDIVPWRPSTDNERETFYLSKFRSYFYRNASPFVRDIANVSEWACIDKNGQFIRGTIGKEIKFESFNQLQEFLLEHSAISAYYGTGNLFTVDIDSKDVAKYGNCPRHSKFGFGYLKDGSNESLIRQNYIKNIDPHGFPYCFECVSISIRGINHIRNILLDIGVKEENIWIYFSGQGSHLECNDPQLIALGRSSRGFLASYFSASGIPIDKVVTYGENRVLRIPGSLHGKVNRVKVLLPPGEMFDVNVTGVI
jgi:DNA primase catalytic subunit